MTFAHIHHPLAIQPSHIDHMGHVNNAVYLNWVQEAVVKHWEKFAPAEAQARYSWVALKHEITYRQAAFLEDNLVATVVLEKVKGVRAVYRTAIKRGEEVLAEIESTWCSLDALTMRPVRIATDIVSRFRRD